MTATFHPTPSEAYDELGIGAISAELSPQRLYLDVVKRALCNFIYEDPSLWAYGPDKRLLPLNRFDLRMRMLGQDLPLQAHTMVGWRRLTNIESCARSIIEAGTPGDFVETGVLRGGSAIFMRAVLKAYGVTDRRVFACDTFVAPQEPRASKVRDWAGKGLFKVVSWLTRIPSAKWRLYLFRQMEQRQGSWPPSANPSQEWVDFCLALVRYAERNQALIQPKDVTSVSAVRSHFARYGLLDSQVELLQGFFADTLPKAPIRQVALLRCDGDTYESTRSVLDVLYEKVSVGGYVIIDDYHSFADAKDAVDQFRRERAITDELVKIDDSAVFWQRSQALDPHLPQRSQRP